MVLLKSAECRETFPVFSSGLASPSDPLRSIGVSRLAALVRFALVGADRAQLMTAKTLLEDAVGGVVGARGEIDDPIAALQRSAFIQRLRRVPSSPERLSAILERACENQGPDIARQIRGDVLSIHAERGRAISQFFDDYGVRFEAGRAPGGHTISIGPTRDAGPIVLDALLSRVHLLAQHWLDTPLLAQGFEPKLLGAEGSFQTVVIELVPRRSPQMSSAGTGNVALPILAAVCGMRLLLTGVPATRSTFKGTGGTLYWTSAGLTTAPWIGPLVYERLGNFEMFDTALLDSRALLGSSSCS